MVADPTTTLTDTATRTETDSHADTCALGSNFLLVETTDWTCCVKPFHKSYSPQNNVPVVTGATAYDNPLTNETVILIFHQSLWFGASLGNTLISPQQIRAFGHSLCDDPYDPFRNIGINVEDNDFIPFNVKNSMVGLDTRCPSLSEYHEKRHIIMTSPQFWDPASQSLPHHSLDERLIHAVHSGQSEDCLEGSELDTLCDNISTVLSSISMTQKVIRDQQVAAIDSHGKYSRYTPEEIASHFQIGLQTARQTLQATAQFGARSAIHLIV